METLSINQENLHVWQKRAKPTVMALGYFDGLHNGHRHVIKKAAKIARSNGLPLSVMSFTPHPKMVLSNGREEIHHIMSLDGKEEKLKELGVDLFHLVKFDKAFAALSPEQFAKQYLVDLGVVHAVAGFDFTYGSRGAGNLDRLQTDSNGHIFVTKVEKIAYCEEKISSTCIRKRILEGNVEELPHFLGHLYEVKCQWKDFSFQPDPNYTLPKPGVYEVELKGEKDLVEEQILITEDGRLKCRRATSFEIEGPFSIVWKRRLRDSVHDQVDKIIVH